MFRLLRRGTALRRIHPSSTTPTPGWLADFCASLSRSGLAPLTFRAYCHDIHLFYQWLETIKPTPIDLSDLHSADLLSYRQHSVNILRLRPATINQRLQAIRQLCRWALKQGFLSSDPSLDIRSLRLARRRCPLGLTDSEIHALLRVAGESRRTQAKRNYALVQLLLQTGIRVGELAGLQIGDAKVRDRSGELRIHGKGQKEREVPLNASARRAVRLYLEARGKTSSEEPLFLSERGRSLSVRSIEHLLRRLARKAKITRAPVTPHVLRHTFALSYLRQNPGQLVELANLLGHESLDTTAIYTQPSGEELADDLERSHLNVYG